MNEPTMNPTAGKTARKTVAAAVAILVAAAALAVLATASISDRAGVSQPVGATSDDPGPLAR